VRRADLFRRKQSAFNLETKSSKVSPNSSQSARRDHAADVLDENPPCAGLDDDAAGWRPEIPLVLFTLPLSGEAVRLARDSANEAIHDATPWAAVEGSHIAPHRRWSQETCFHRRYQSCDGPRFPLHQHDRASVWNCQLDAEIESGAAAAQADEVELGT
jgi:hypothetical protein